MSRRKHTSYAIEPTNRPLIGVVNGWGVANIVDSHGGVAFGIDDKYDAEACLPYLDGIIFTGGGDINPDLYGVPEHQRHKEVYGVSASRDELEFPLMQGAIKRGLAIMGICRGNQLINVAHGGTLHQHLDDINGHSHWGTQHDVKLSRRSALSKALKTRALHNVSSFHHQSIDRLGMGLVPIGWEYDGTVEAIETVPDTIHYALGVQFHPEMDWQTDTDSEGIFLHFIRQAQGRNKLGMSGFKRYAELEDVTNKARPAKTYDYQYHGKGLGASTVYDSWRDGSAGFREDLGCGYDYTDSDQSIAHSWWDDERQEWRDDDDAGRYDEWLRLNDIGIAANNRQESCDAMCAFPPCRKPDECDADESDCYSMRLAEGQVAQGSEAAVREHDSDDSVIEKLKRGNRRGGSK